MPSKPNPVAGPLSSAERDTLATHLAQSSPFDLDGTLGVLHAVAVAPGLVPPSAWLQVILPNGPGALDQAGVQAFVGLLMRQYNEVIAAVDARGAILPDAEDGDACDAFASGFVAGAEADPRWIGDHDRWTFASWAAYLAGRHELVPPGMLEKFDEFPNETKPSLRRSMGAIIVAAYESSLEIRRAGQSGGARGGRVGRNDPCPCGSGKKFKRCCIDVKPVAD